MFNFVKQFIRGYQISRDISVKGKEIKERHNTTIEEASVPRTREGLESYFGEDDGRELYRGNCIGSAIVNGKIQPRGTFGAGFELGRMLHYMSYAKSAYMGPQAKERLKLARRQEFAMTGVFLGTVLASAVVLGAVAGVAVRTFYEPSCPYDPQQNELRLQKSPVDGEFEVFDTSTGRPYEFSEEATK